MTKNNLIWVDNVKSPEFNQAFDEFKEYGIIGFDTEFVPCFSKFDKSGVALI